MLRLLMCLFGFHGATEIDHTIDDEEIMVCRDCLKEVKQTLVTSVAFCRTHYGIQNPAEITTWRGFSFLIGDYMTDKVQAKQDLEFCSAELSKYQNLSRTGLTWVEMLTIDRIMIKLRERIKNLREALYA